VPCQNFRYAAATSAGRSHLFQLITNMRQQQFDFRDAACRYLRNSWAVSLTGSSQPSALSAKILYSDSEVTSINMGKLLRVPCDRYLASFNFRRLFDNSHYAVSDIAARDLVSSCFRFPWELTLGDFRAFARALRPPIVRLSLPLPHPAAPPGGTSEGMLRNRWRGSYPSFS
jgi:hypothetical protein